MFSFNLVDEKWIPRIMPDGSRQERSLIEVLLKAGEIKEIFDSSPLATVALHRLLLAILHCNFGPANKVEWQKIWNRGRFDEGRLLNYFHHWHGRFDLFDERYPFYQSASVPFSGSNSKGKLESYENSIASLAHELAIYLNKATLFDNTTESSSPTVSSSEAARLLLAFQSFALGKLSSKPRLKGEESAKAAPLVKGAVCLVQGNNLFETLMLNLHCYNRDDAEPFDMDKDDAPAWERNEETLTQDRFPKGYLDLLTWQNRRVKLHPEQ